MWMFSALAGPCASRRRKILLGIVAAVLFMGASIAYAPPSLERKHLSVGRCVYHSKVLPFQTSAKFAPRETETFTSTRRCDNPMRHRGSYALHMSSSNDSSSMTKSLGATSILILFDIGFRRLFKLLSISFPSSLAGCGVLFATMLTWSKGSETYDVLSPGATLLAKWLPLFFVPSLITLPLAAGLGTAMEVLKIVVAIVGGFHFSLLSTSWSVLGVRKLVSEGKDEEETDELDEEDDELTFGSDTTNLAPPPKAFSDETASLFRVLLCLAGSAALATSTSMEHAHLVNPTSSAFMLFATLHNFVFGARLPKKFTKFVHPLVTCTTLTWVAAKLLGIATQKSFRAVLKSYRTGSLSLATVGAGDVLLFLLGPAVVSLACQMYDRRKLMRENMAEVGTAIGVSSIGGLFGTASLVRLLNIGNPYVRLSLLSRNITSPLAMAVASILGADVSLAVTIVVLSGLIGANFGASILDAFNIKDAVARGLGIGAAAHGLGTAAFANEKDAFPFAAIAMAMTASATTVLVSISPIRRAILQLTLGY